MSRTRGEDLANSLEQLAKLADFLDREIAGCCDPDDEFVIAPMFGVQAMRDTRTALEVVVKAVQSAALVPQGCQTCATCEHFYDGRQNNGDPQCDDERDENLMGGRIVHASFGCINLSLPPVVDGGDVE